MPLFAPRDPLDHPEELIRRVYAYVAARLGPGSRAEDVTSDVFERALRYRASYDPSKGEPISWLIGIARRCVTQERERDSSTVPLHDLPGAVEDLAEAAVLRVSLAQAVAVLDERDRELIALRYGADLTAREIGELLLMRTNTVEVALHRALGRIRAALDGEPPTEAVPPRIDARGRPA